MDVRLVNVCGYLLRADTIKIAQNTANFVILEDANVEPDLFTVKQDRAFASEKY
jgi:hypothetical protein